MQKSTLQVSTKADIIPDPLHELICNTARQLIITARLKLSSGALSHATTIC
ncbi:MAG: hypothetical protein ACTS73_02345 [Arsenophonus sp. NEOnobi-MAG3]